MNMLKRLNRPTRCKGLLKSNSFRRSAKEQSAEVTDVEEQLKQKPQELKSNE